MSEPNYDLPTGPPPGWVELTGNFVMMNGVVYPVDEIDPGNPTAEELLTPIVRAEDMGKRTRTPRPLPPDLPKPGTQGTTQPPAR